MRVRTVAVMLLLFVFGRIAISQSLRLDPPRLWRISSRFSNDGVHLFHLGTDGLIQVIDCEEGELKHTLSFSSYSSTTSLHTLFANEKHLVAGPVLERDGKRSAVVFSIDDVLKNANARPTSSFELGGYGGKFGGGYGLAVEAELRDIVESDGSELIFGRSAIRESSRVIVSSGQLMSLNIETGVRTAFPKDLLQIGLPSVQIGNRKRGSAYDLFRLAQFKPLRMWYRKTENNQLDVFRLIASMKEMKTRVDHLVVDLEKSPPTAAVKSRVVVPLWPNVISPDGSKYLASWYRPENPDPQGEFTQQIFLGNLQDKLVRSQLIRLRTLSHPKGRSGGTDSVHWSEDGQYFFLSDCYRTTKLRRCVISMHTADGRVIRQFAIRGKYFGIVAASPNGKYIVTKTEEGGRHSPAVTELWSTKRSFDLSAVRGRLASAAK